MRDRERKRGTESGSGKRALYKDSHILRVYLLLTIKII